MQRKESKPPKGVVVSASPPGLRLFQHVANSAVAYRYSASEVPPTFSEAAVRLAYARWILSLPELAFYLTTLAPDWEPKNPKHLHFRTYVSRKLLSYFFPKRLEDRPLDAPPPWDLTATQRAHIKRIIKRTPNVEVDQLRELVWRGDLGPNSRERNDIIQQFLLNSN